MEQVELKKALEGLGLKKQEIEIVLGCVKGVRVAPLAYSQLNDLTSEVVDAKAFKEKVEGALGVITGPAKKPIAAPVRKVKPAAESPAPTMSVTSKETEILASGPGNDPAEEEEAKPKKKPTPRGGKKETADEIKENVSSLGNVYL